MDRITDHRLALAKGRALPHLTFGVPALVLGLILGTGQALAGSPSAIEATFSKLDVVLTGRITGRCQVSGGGDFAFGELTGNETVDETVGLDCNVPFDLNLRSARGGLAHAGLPDGQGPFAGTLGYTVKLSVPTLSPAPQTLQASYTSAELAGGKTLSSGDAIAAGGGRMEVQTAPVTGAGLLAGEYSETLTVTVTQRL